MLRPQTNFPRAMPGPADIKIDLPLSRKTAFGFNPSLERRVNFRLSCVEEKGQKKNCYINVNYLVEDPVFETAYRCDVRRVETAEKMAIKQGDDFLREEEFCNVTTPFALAK